jgi:hypothetical protein
MPHKAEAAELTIQDALQQGSLDDLVHRRINSMTNLFAQDLVLSK